MTWLRRHPVFVAYCGLVLLSVILGLRLLGPERARGVALLLLAVALAAGLGIAQVGAGRGTPVARRRGLGLGGAAGALLLALLAGGAGARTGGRLLLVLLLLGLAAVFLQAGLARDAAGLRLSGLLVVLYLLPSIASAWLIGLGAAVALPRLEPARDWLRLRLAADADRPAPITVHRRGSTLAIGDDETKSLDDPIAYLAFMDPALQRHFRARQVYLRSRVFTQFDGRRWDVPRAPARWLKDADDGATDGVLRLSAGLGHPHRVFLTEHAPPDLLTLPEPAAVNVPRLIHSGPAAYQLPIREGQRVAYTATAEPLLWADLPPGALRVGRAAPELLQIPDTPTARRLGQAAATITRTAPDLRRRIDFLLAYMRANYRYERRSANPRREDPLADFFFETRTGNCQLYATSFVVMARALGIPARLGVGLAGASPDPQTGVYAYTGYNQHAWPELDLDGYGWVIVDPTPADLGDSSSAAAATRAQSAFDANAYQLLGGTLADLDLPAAAAPAAASSRVGLVLALLVSVGAFLLAAVARRRRQAILGAALAGVGPEPGYLQALSRHFALARSRRRPGTTLAEYLDALRDEGLLTDELAALQHYHYATRYQGQPRDPAREKTFIRQIRALPRPRQAAPTASAKAAAPA